MDFNNINLDKDTEELLHLLIRLKKNNREKYIEVKGIVKGILISKQRTS